METPLLFIETPVSGGLQEPSVACKVRSSATHILLVEEAGKWLARKGCSVVITEMAHRGPEIADVIGWRGKYSTVVECKASIADFQTDLKKHFRSKPERGMGCQRYFCAMRGMLHPDKVPPKWGLIEWDGKKMREAKSPEHHTESADREEISLLVSALRRIAGNAPRGFSVKCYTIESKNRATIASAPLEDGEKD